MSELTLDALLKDRQLHRLPQPEKVELHTADGLYIRLISLKDAGTIVPQHSHHWSHTTVVATGGVIAWKNGEMMGEFTAPTGIYIEKGAKHTFVTTVPNTLLLCCHNLHGEEQVKVLEEHDIVV